MTGMIDFKVGAITTLLGFINHHKSELFKDTVGSLCISIAQSSTNDIGSKAQVVILVLVRLK